MKQLDYVRPADAAQAVAAVSANPQAVFLAGGTNLVDHLKLGIATPEVLVDVRQLALDLIEENDVGLRSARTYSTATLPPNRGCVPSGGPSPAPCLPGRPARSQSGDDRRKPAAAHALRLLPGRHHCLQQASTGGLVARRPTATAVTTRFSVPARPAWLSTLPTWQWHWPRSTPSLSSWAATVTVDYRPMRSIGCPATSRTATRAWRMAT
jgi:hypothetical protein